MIKDVHGCRLATGCHR